MLLPHATQGDAEEMCTILQEAFQLVYTEATMEHFSESINMGEKGRGSILVPAPLSPIRKQQIMQSKCVHGETCYILYTHIGPIIIIIP